MRIPVCPLVIGTLENNLGINVVNAKVNKPK